MKKLLLLIFVLALLLLCGCDAMIEDILGGAQPDNVVDTDNNDSDKEESEHNYEINVIDPICGRPGYTTHSCDHCGDYYVTDELPALKHKYSAVVTAPDCTHTGYTTYTCDYCGNTYERDKVSALGHSYEAIVTAPTCDEPGYTTYVCIPCGYFYAADQVDPIGHSYDAVVTAPTVDSNGYTTYTCKVCGVSYVDDIVGALGHNYVGVVTAPTCLDGGYTTYTCYDCGDSYVADEVSPLGHGYKSVVTAPTCTLDGYTTYTCVRCAVYYTSNKTNATGHSWKPATTSAPKTCTNCGLTEGEKLPSSVEGALDMLYVTYIDVGQGDSILIKVGDCDILIDAGTANYGSTVSNYLKSQGVDDVELIINTHADADHCGGLTKVLKDFKVEAVWASPLTKTTAAYKNFAAAVKSEGLTMQNPAVGTVFTYEYLTLTVLYDGSGTSDANDSSIVVMVEYGEYRFLFTGDISSTIENKLANNKNIDLSCDVLKVAHHGSRYSSSSTFLKATGAKYGVICVGADNTYGHPTSTALNNLKNAGISVYRTDLNGHVVFATDGENMTLPGGGGTVSKTVSVEAVSEYASVSEYAYIVKRIMIPAFVVREENVA